MYSQTTYCALKLLLVQTLPSAISGLVPGLDLNGIFNLRSTYRGLSLCMTVATHTTLVSSYH
jgi:hypothetical protein